MATSSARAGTSSRRRVLAGVAVGPGGAGGRGEIRDLRYPIGAGVSNETILFEAVVEDGGTAAVRPLVLRVSPSSEYQLFLDVAFGAQYRVMKALGEHGRVRVAAMVGLDDDPTWFGRPFLVMEQLQGRVPVSMPVYNTVGWLYDATPEQRRIVWESATRQLGRIHQVPTDCRRLPRRR